MVSIHVVNEMHIQRLRPVRPDVIRGIPALGWREQILLLDIGIIIRPCRTCSHTLGTAMTDRSKQQGAKEASMRDRRAQAARVADCAERVLPYFEEAFPDDDRPRKAIEAARAWARGEIRVGEARTAALAAHAAARFAAERPAACAAARAAGHAAATAHMVGHAPHAAAYAKKAAAACTAAGGAGSAGQQREETDS